MLGALSASPLYFAMIVWLPKVSDDVLKLAIPPARATVPSGVTPSKKVTVPVGAEPVTVAVNVTWSPTIDGFSEDVSVVVVGGRAVSVMRHSLFPVPSFARK